MPICLDSSKPSRDRGIGEKADEGDDVRDCADCNRDETKEGKQGASADGVPRGFNAAQVKGGHVCRRAGQDGRRDVVEDVVDGRHDVKRVDDEPVEQDVEHREEHDVLDRRERGRRVDALANLDELHEHEQGEDGLGNRYDERLMDGRHHVPYLSTVEERVEGSRYGRA